MSFIVALALGTADPEQFAVPSMADGRPLYGQVDAATNPRAVALLVAGYGAHTRDYRFATNPDGGEYVWYRDLARRLQARGISVVRYDKRGYSCFKPGAPKSDGRRCADPVESATTTLATSLGDIEALTYRAAQVEGGKCLILIAHSAGGYYAARLAEEGRIAPAGFIGLGTFTMSPAEVEKTRFVDLFVDALIATDVDRNGRITSAEIRATLDRTRAANRLAGDGTLSLPLELQPDGTRLPIPAAGFTRAELELLRKRLYHAWWKKREADRLIPLDRVIWDSGFAVGRASNHLLEDWMPVAYRWRGYGGRLSFHLTGRDPFMDARLSREALERWGPPGASFRLYEGLDHYFGPTAPRSPAREDAMEGIVADAAATAGDCAKAKS